MDKSQPNNQSSKNGTPGDRKDDSDGASNPNSAGNPVNKGSDQAGQSATPPDQPAAPSDSGEASLAELAFNEFAGGMSGSEPSIKPDVPKPAASTEPEYSLEDLQKRPDEKARVDKIPEADSNMYKSAGGSKVSTLEEEAKKAHEEAREADKDAKKADQDAQKAEKKAEHAEKEVKQVEKDVKKVESKEEKLEKKVDKIEQKVEKVVQEADKAGKEAGKAEKEADKAEVKADKAQEVAKEAEQKAEKAQEEVKAMKEEADSDAGPSPFEPVVPEAGMGPESPVEAGSSPFEAPSAGPAAESSPFDAPTAGSKSGDEKTEKSKSDKPKEPTTPESPFEAPSAGPSAEGASPFEASGGSPFDAPEKPEQEKESEPVAEGEVVEEESKKDAPSEEVPTMEEEGQGGAFDDFKGKVQDALGEANIGKKQVFLFCGGCLFLIVFIALAVWGVGKLVTPGDEKPKEKPKQEEPVKEEKKPTKKEEESETEKKVEEREPVTEVDTLSGGILLGQEAGRDELGLDESLVVARLIGEEAKEFHNRFVQQVALLRELKNMLDIDIYKYLDQTRNRRTSLEEYIAKFKGVELDARESLAEINDRLSLLKAAFENAVPRKDEYEARFFEAMRTLAGEESSQWLEEFVTSKRDLDETKARFRATAKLKEYYELVLAKVALRQKAIELNKEALVKGVQIVPIEGSNLDLIISETEMLED